MKRYIVTRFLTLAVLVSVGFATPTFAQTTDGAAQIQALLAQVKALQAQVAQLQGQPTNTNACLSLSYNLYADQEDASTNGEVTKLQQFLAQDSSIYPAGLVTGYFGPMTETAVQRWQARNGVVSSGSPDTTGYGYVGPKTRAAMSCGGSTAYQPNVNPPVITPTPTPPQDTNTVYFSSTFFDYGYTIGDPVSGTYSQQLIVTNGSKKDAHVKITVDNQPAWLNTSYNTNTLTINPGQPMGIGVSVNPIGLDAGTYKTEINISGDFTGSPKTIPVTLRIYEGATPVTQSLNITNPLDGHAWTVGDTQTFRWTTSGIASGAVGYIELVDSYGGVHRISNVPNTGSYTWTNVGTINGTTIPVTPPAGNYSVKIIMNNIGDIVGPLTIKEKQSQPIAIGATFSNPGFDGQYKKYILYLSGGTTANPVKWWTLNFTCPSNVPEVNAKVAGNVCDGQPYQLGNENTGTGNVDIPLNILYTDLNAADLKIHIKATGKDGGTMGEIDYVLPVHKG